ncbi:MAG: hypothetical protein LBV02_05520 [Bacteroidales bacterium]|nr:hypothetical protein [Bacteroidales bacterium]
MLLFICITVLEYYSFFSTAVRTVLFYSELAILLLTLAIFVLYPLFKILGLGKRITNEDVAKIVGKHFSEIDDKFLNIIQLEKQISEGEYKSYQLLLAAIDHKIEDIEPFYFIKAIPFKKTVQFAKWALIPVFLFLVIFSIKSEVFTESTERIVKHQQYFEKPAPYSFEILNGKMTAFQNEDFLLQVKVIGDVVPNELYVSFNHKKYKFTKISNTEFGYNFSKLQKNIDFQLVTDEVISRPYAIEVLPKPVTISFAMELFYPAYLNKAKEIINNSGDATIPEGTMITWKFYTKNTDSLIFIQDEKSEVIAPQNDNISISRKAHDSFTYSVVNKNGYFTSNDTMKNSIFVVKDQYPEIVVESQRDTFFYDRIYFKGNIKDDYGFHDLRFRYSTFNEMGDRILEDQAINIEINRQTNIQDFYYFFDAGMFALDAGYRMEYYFEIRDNDAINGYKSTKTPTLTYRVKTAEEVDREISNTNEQTKSEMTDIMKETAQLLKDIEKLNQQMIQTNNPSWQDKKKLESLMERFQDLQAQLAEVKQQQQQKNQLEDQFKNISEEILKKQEDLQKRMDELLTDEMKQMLEQMQQMMDQMNKDKMMEAMDKMKENAEDLNKSLDAQLQLFKQLEYEKKSNELIEKAKQLANDEKELSKESLDKNAGKEDLIKKQEDIQNQFKNLQKDIKNLEHLNKELEEPNKMTNTDELQKKIQEKMKESVETLQKNNKRKASESQEEAGDAMEQLASQMEDDMLDSQEEQLAEDIATIRQTLDNLVQISFRLEDNMTMLKTLNVRSSQLNNVKREQFVIQEYMKLIDDSLTALARRQPEIQPFINKEVTKIRDYLAQAQANMNEGRLPKATSDQQFAFTSMNNLALMLAESMKKMNQQMNNCKNCKNKKKDGDSSCSNPGDSGKPNKAKSARELQQQLNRQMEALKRSMEQGQKEGEKNPGGMSGAQQQMSEQLAKMAAQQEAIRKMMQDLQSELKSKDGVGDKSIDEMIKEMEATERDLVNRIISQQTINRQKTIETRLLESEKAQMEKEKEEKRESTEARDIKNLNPPKDWEMDKRSEKQNEMLRTVPVNLNYYYKEKVNKYFFNIE